MPTEPRLAALKSDLQATFSALGLFSALAPRDPARKLGTARAYGPLSRQKLDVYAPRRMAKPAPVAVFFYGGSWESGRRQDYGWVGQALAARGFLTLVADYRLHPHVAYPDFLHDAALAVKWAVSHASDHGGDPHRLVLIGHSAGAYNAVMLGLDPQYLKAVGVDAHRIRAVAGLSGPYDFLPLDGPITRQTFGHAPDLPATQPMTHVRPDAPPAFLATGDKDNTVRPRNTRRLAKALREAGVLVEEKHYEGVDHAGTVLALSRLMRRKAPLLDDMVSFLLDRVNTNRERSTS